TTSATRARSGRLRRRAGRRRADLGSQDATGLSADGLGHRAPGSHRVAFWGVGAARAPSLGRGSSSTTRVWAMWLVSVVRRGEHEAFDGDVGIDVVGAEERDHLASRDLFDPGGEVVAHRELVGAARLEHEVGLAVADKAEL